LFLKKISKPNWHGFKSHSSDLFFCFYKSISQA
jgi:hypothetical protein